MSTVLALQASEENKPISILVGQSQIVRPPWPVARVSVTDPNIADVQTLTPEQVLVLGKKPGSTDLVMWSADEKVWRARLDVGVDVARIKADLTSMFPGAELDVAYIQNVLVVTGQLRRSEDADALKRFMEKTGVQYIDRTGVAGIQQVEIKVRVAEVQRSALRLLAADTSFGTNGDPIRGGRIFNGASTNTLNPTVEINSGGAFTNIAQNPTFYALNAFVPEWKMNTFIQALQENQYLRILAEPSLKCISGEDASFLAGGEFPIPVLQGGGTGNSSNSITITYKEFGTRLRFRPTVLGDNTIRLQVAPEVSELTDQGSVNIQGFRIPAVLTRRAETTLELKSGQTFSIAGLIQSRSDGTNSKTPLLGDLPVLGSLFRSVRYQRGETELVIIVTADLVEPLNVGQNTAVPGSMDTPPNDWELYAKGKLDGDLTARCSPADGEWLESKGLNRLRGPGAWMSYDREPAASTTSYRPPPPTPGK